MHVDADGGQLGHCRDDPHEPVRPTRHETGERTYELLCVTGKRAGHRAVGEQLAERAHDVEDRNPTERVAEQESRTRLVNGAGRSQEESDANGASKRNELDVPALEAASESFGILHS